MGNCCGKEETFLSFRILSDDTSVHAESHILAGQTSRARSESEILASPHLKAFSFNELRNATKNFRPENLLGEGGFGYVYKGWVNEQTLVAARPGSGLAVAVKKLKPHGFQGHKEWLSELNYLGQLHHPNLVKLIGYCSDGDNRLLVYEFMPKGSLENHIFRRNSQPLPWETRVKVAIGAAHGLAFLHNSESQVIYRDFKASNVLLDPEFNAKLSDFGLAKSGPTGDRTHVSTQVLGTHGYAAPEYIATGRLTSRCDVYSFGVVLLEMLTGRRAIDRIMDGRDQKLVDWVRPLLGDKSKVMRIMDSRLEGRYPRKGAYIATGLALSCVDPDAKSRPTMAEVVTILEKLPTPKFVTPMGGQSVPRAALLKSPQNHSPMNSSPQGVPLPSHMTRDHPHPSSLLNS